MLAGFAVGVGLLALRNGARVDTLIPNPYVLKPALRKLGIAAAFGFLTFAVAQPYAILDLPYYAATPISRARWSAVSSTSPTPVNMTEVFPSPITCGSSQCGGVGLPLAVLMWAGFGFTAVRAALKRTRADILLLAWFLPFFLITGLAEVKFLRYLLPVTPFLAIMAASLSDKGLTRLRALRPSHNFLVRGWGGGAGTRRIRHGLLLVRICQRLHGCPPGHSSLGLCQGAHPSDSVLAMEHWEESLPNLHSYRRITLQLYDPDDTPIQYTEPRGFHRHREQGRAPRRRPRQHRLRYLFQQPALREHPHPPRPISSQFPLLSAPLCW